MAEAAGWSVLPLSISFQGVFKELQSQLVQPMQKAAKTAGGDLEKTVISSAQKAEQAVSKANYRMQKSAEELTAAESKLRAEKDKQAAAAKLLEAAESKVDDLRKSGKASVESLAKAEADALKKRASLETATRNVVKAESGVEKALTESARAADSYAKRMDDLKDAQSGVADSAEKSGGVFSKLGDRFGEMGDKASNMGGPLGDVGEMLSNFKLRPAAGVAAVAGALGTAAGAAFKLNEDLSNARVTMQNQFGLSADAARDMQGEIADALGNGLGSYEETAEAVMAINQSLADDVGHMAGESASSLSDNFMTFTQTFGTGMSETVALVDNMLNTDMVESAEEGIDLLTAGFQRVPQALQGEVMDAMNEYSKHFSNMGIGGSEAMAMLVDASGQGQIAIDKVGDAVKEFSLKAIDPAVAEKLSEFGVGVEDMAGKVARGGEDASGAMQDLAQQILDIEDPGLRAEAAVVAFGAPLEDLGADKIPAFLEGLSAGGDGMGEFAGASQTMSDNTTKTFTGMFDSLKGKLQGFAIDSSLALNEWGGKAVGAIADGISGAFESIKSSEFMSNAQAGIDEIKAAFTGLWETVQPYIEQFGEYLEGNFGDALESLGGALGNIVGAVGSLAGSVGGALLDTFKALWDFLSPVLVPIFQTLAGIMGGVLVGAAAGLSEAFKFVSGAIEVVTGVLSWLVDNVIAPAIGWVGDLAGVLTGVLKGGFDIIGNTLAWLRDLAVNAWQWIGDKFVWFRDLLGAGKDYIVGTVFGGLQYGIDRLKGWFQTGVDGIGRIWDGLKEAAATPIRFVVNTVWNNGLLKAINAVTGFIGMDEVAPIQLGFATGGILPGYTPGRDIYQFVEPRTGMRIGLSGGEPILRPEAGRVLGPDWVDGINAAARVGGTVGVEKFLGGFAHGGVVASISDIVRKNFPMMTITSTYRAGDPGHHGTGNAVDFSNGFDTTPQMQAATKWFHDNYGSGLYELIHSPSQFNVKNGQNVGDGFGLYGAGTMNEHRNHVHIASPQPLGDPKTMVEMVWDGVVGVFTSMRQRTADLINGIMEPLIDSIPSFGDSVFGRIPKSFARWGLDNVLEFVGGKADEFHPAGGVAGSAESWREMAMHAMRRQGFNADDPAQVNAMLAQIQSESGGDPNIAQQIVDVNGTGESAGVGLLQIIPGTFEAHRDPTLPNDRRDPEANMNAALRYYKATYGTDLTTMWGHGHGYANGGIVDLVNALKPTLFDSGGAWKSGTLGLNLSGSDEVVFNNQDWAVIKAGILSNGKVAEALGEFTKAMGEEMRTSAEDYALDSARGVLGYFGLDPLVDLGVGIANRVSDIYGEDPLTVGLSRDGVYMQNSRGRASFDGVTIVIEAESDDDLVRAGQLRKLAEQVRGIDVELRKPKRPKAAAVTRGGAM